MSERHPRIVSITAGGAGMFCGSCMRDNALAAELLRREVEITLVPAFTPIRTDEEDVSAHRVVMGGINVYIEQRWPWFGRLPGVVRRALDSPRLLNLLSRAALQTRRDDDGELARTLLLGEAGPHAAETRDLVSFVEELQPDVVSLTNLLLAGFVPLLKRDLGLPVTVTLQGDDVFLDALPDRDRSAVLQEMRRVAREVDLFITFTDDYAARMAQLFEIPRDRIRCVPLGLAAPDAFERPRASPELARPPTVGYLARLCPEKGLHRLVDAFLCLRNKPGMDAARLHLAGWLGELDRPFVEEQLGRLRRALGEASFAVVDVPDRESKARFLHGVDLLSVPTEYEEPKGLFVLEALAAGVPVVQPAHGSFPELLASTGGGVLVAPGSPEALAEALHLLLRNREERLRLGDEGRKGVVARHTVTHMADASLEAWSELAARRAPSAGAVT